MCKSTCSPIVCMGFVICLVSFLVVQIRDLIILRSFVKGSTTNASSLWCYDYNNGGKMCKFRNLYYIPSHHQFLFLLSSESVLRGINGHADLMHFDLSSVLFHNRFLMNLVIVNETDSVFNKNVVIEDNIFIMWRFKRDNIMHVIHDDLLPLYETYSYICTGVVEDCVLKYSLAFADEGDFGPYVEWYNIFSNKKPILLHKGNNNSIMCFQEAFVGLDRSSVWFQYGFNTLQGPVEQPKTSSNQIHRFTEYVCRKFDISVPPPNLKEKRESTAVLFSRKINRKIMNENDIILVIHDIYRKVSKESSLQLFNTDLSINNTRSILSVLRKADFVIGMHGSAMILTMFAKPGTAVLELFPYGIKPEVVSPLRALCQIQGIGLLYDSWRNVARKNSVVHPNAPPLLGGIHHLPIEEQQKIQSITEVPAVPCCHNPVYLFRMYQDTWVNVSDFSSVLSTILLKQRSFSIQSFWEDLQNETFMHWYFPAPVSNIHCKVEDGRLRIFWTVPVNVKNGLYDATVIMENGFQVTSQISSPEFTLDIPDVVHEPTKVLVWVKCIANHRESHDTYKECSVSF